METHVYIHTGLTSRQEMIDEALSGTDVSNVYIYVGDAVREDYLSDRVQTQGATIRTVAGSTHSPTSFATLLTGLYAPHHGVETFTDRLRSDTVGLFDILDIETGFINSIFAFAEREHSEVQDPIFNVLGVDRTSTSLKSISSPFVLIERGPGGHAPYGDFDGGASEYFRARAGADTSTIRSDYARSIDRDVELFERRLDTLADRGLLDDTLVIYTSDHGEMLGENGLLGHNGPMRPELVYVPTAFIHPEIPADKSDTDLMHHVDLLPTVCDLLDRGETYVSEMDGSSMLSDCSNEPRPTFWSNQFLPDSIPLFSGRLAYRGVWDNSGGHVFATPTRSNRLAVLAGKLAKSSKRSYMRRHLTACLRAYLRGDSTYGRPAFSRSDARRILDSAPRNSAESEATTLTEDGRQQLADLGYME